MSNLDEITIGDTFDTSGSAGSNAATVVQIGERIGTYEVTAFLGRGGMGEVYEAFAALPSAVAVGTPVAIKFLRQGQFSPTNRRRFEREAAYLKALNHPGIVRLYEILEWNGHPCIVMQYAPGRNLDEIMPSYGDPHLAEPHIADLIAQALEALHAAHLAGILHRDLKPGNLRISPQGRVMILDFGMAMRREEHESRLTASGSILGTPAYMSPEQARGQQDMIGPRSDIYAMGAVLYELATGKQPFYAPNPVALLRCVLDEPLTLPTKHRPELSRDLETVIITAMSKDPRDRYESAEAMAADLRRLHRGQRIRRRRTSKWRILVRQSWHHRRAIAVWGLGIFIVFAGATIGVEHYNSKAKEVEERDRRILEQDAKLKEEMERQQANWVEVWSCPDMEWIQNQVWTSDKTEPISVPRPNGVKGWQIMTREPPTLQNPQGKRIPLRIDSGIDIWVKITPLTSESGDIEFFFHNKNGFGVGYGVILSLGTKDSKSNVQIVKWTEGRLDGRNYETMAQEFLPETPASFSLRILRDGAKIQVFLNETMIPEFVDLEPLEGHEYANTYVVFNPLTVKIQNLTIKRQRPSELVNRVALADSARLQEKYDYAIALYEAYRNDFPTTTQTTQATYGLALAKLGFAGISPGRIRIKDDDPIKTAALQEALELLRRIVDDPTSTERYRLAALFRAWSTSVRLGRGDMEEADKFFIKLQEIPDLDKLLKVTPLGLLQDLPNRYAQAANRLRNQADSLESALQLYQKAIDLAKYLSRDKRLDWNIIVHCYTNMNDLLWHAQQYDRSLEILQTAEKTIAPFRPTVDLIAAQAETCMLLTQTNSSTNAAVLWHLVLTTTDPRVVSANDPRYAERARIWLGQILQDSGNITGAQRVWNGQSNAINGADEKNDKTQRPGVTDLTRLLARRKDLPFDRAFLVEKKIPSYLWADLIYLRVLRLLEQKPLRPETIDQCLLLLDDALDLPIADPNDKNSYYTNFPIPLILNLRDFLMQEVSSP